MQFHHHQALPSQNMSVFLLRSCNTCFDSNWKVLLSLNVLQTGSGPLWAAGRGQRHVDEKINKSKITELEQTEWTAVTNWTAVQNT